MKVNWAKVDLWLSCFLIILSMFICYYKFSYGYVNWYTGLFLLGLLPVTISNYLRDRKK